MNREASRIRKRIRALLESQHLAVLATAGPTFPYCTLVGFAFSRDLSTIIMATVRETRKFANIMSDPSVSLLVDSRTNSVEDFKSAAALTILGSASEVTGPGLGPYRRLYLARHPHLRGFLGSPNTALVAVRAARYILVERFQEVREYEP